MQRAGLVFLAWSVFGGTACGTGAVGVEDCRAIEMARCEESAACGTVDDVDACRRYYRGHCLHGLAVGARPPRDERDECIAAIRQAGACARELGAEAPLASCPAGPPAEARSERPLETACGVVARPWDTTACAFLNPAPADPNPGPGGASGTGGG